MILLIVASDLVVYRFVDVACLAFQSVERLGWTANLNVFASLMRLAGIAAVLLAAGRRWSPGRSRIWRPRRCVRWSPFIAWSPGWLGRHSAAWAASARDLREGFYFSTSLSAQTIYNDVDKTMLARLATLDAAGIYAAAYRLIDIAFLPIRALLAAAYPSFFRHGEDGIAGSLGFARRLMPKPLMYSAVVAVGMTLAAPLVPHDSRRRVCAHQPGAALAVAVAVAEDLALLRRRCAHRRRTSGAAHADAGRGRRVQRAG